VQVDGMSIRQAAREFGLSRKSIRKMLQFSLPPGYARKKPVQRPKLGPWLAIIDQILLDDQVQPKMQRQRLGARAEEQAVDHFFVLQGQRSQLMGEREDNMCVWRRQQFGPTSFEPTLTGLALTLRAVPVTALLV
jgi:hypothetical protein